MSEKSSPNVLSRHATSEGVLVYARRDDGGLQVWLQPRARRRPELLGESHRPASADEMAACA